MSRLDLSAPQWVAWFSRDPEEREAFRREVREQLRAKLRAAPHSQTDYGLVLDRGAIVERVYLDGRNETLATSTRPDPDR